MSNFNFISYEDSGDALHLTINRPPYNVLDISVLEELSAALDLAIENSTAKVLLITGNDDKIFSAGVDVVDHMPDKVARMTAMFCGIIKRLMMVPIPTVAAINGPALGGGCDLAIACDVVVASETATLGHPEIKLGVFPLIGTIMLPRQTPMTNAMELLLGGGIVAAREAHRVGLVNCVFAKETFASDTAKFIEQFTSQSRVALIQIKKVIREAAPRPFYEALFHIEQSYKGSNAGQVASCTSHA